MKTSFFDYLLSGICILFLVSLSAGTAWPLHLHLESPYGPLVVMAIFLLVYGIYTMLLLAMLRVFHPYPEGSFSMSSGAFTYWKLNAVLVDLGAKALSPFNTVFTQTLINVGFGARIGPGVAMGGVLRDHPLLDIGAQATIGQNSVMTAHAITHDDIVLKRISIGSGAVIGINCVVMPGVELGENAVLAPGAVATVGTKIPANELWGGVPARKLKEFLAPL